MAEVISTTAEYIQCPVMTQKQDVAITENKD